MEDCLDECIKWMSIWINGWMDGYLDEWMYCYLDEWMLIFMNVWMDDCLYECMHG